MPTVLARAGLDNETDCHGGLLSTDFTVKNSTHPVEYQPDAINSTLCAFSARPVNPNSPAHRMQVAPVAGHRSHSQTDGCIQHLRGRPR